jgi:galactokinase
VRPQFHSVVPTYPPIAECANRVSARGPGRVNLIGEHTDYNGGLALPFAIDRSVTVTAQACDGDLVVVEAHELGELDEFPLEPGPAEGWRAFARGVVSELRAAGIAIGGTRLVIEGDLPRGAGLASSAALSTALCMALLGAEDRLDRVELARLCSRVENDWVGARTGLLDQLAALLSREGHALLIDFDTLDLTHVPLELDGWTLATLDSGAARDNAASGYNERRGECARACQLLGVASLRRASAEDASRLPEPLSRRVRHVLEENARVEAAVDALTRGDLDELGSLLDASHASLRDDYDVSVPEVEAAVARLKDAGAAGARMVGGGFGGSVLALLGPGVDRIAGTAPVSPGPGAALV